MKTFLIPEKWVPMWIQVANAIEEAQDNALKAKLRGDIEGMKQWAYFVARRVSAIGNMQRLIFGAELEALSKERGRRAVHTNISTEPPAMIVYDNDEEFYADVKEVHASSEGSATAYGFQSLQSPVQPVNPEGLD